MNFVQILILCAIIIGSNYLWNAVVYDNNQVDESALEEQLPNNNNYSKYFFSFIACLPIIAGLWLINYWFSSYNLAVDTYQWQVYPGKIISKKISQNVNNTVSGHQLSGRTYYPDVEYEFTYNGKVIKWNKIDFSSKPSTGDLDKVQSMLDSLPEEGQPVDVYFSPEKRQAVLYQGVKNTSYLSLIIGVVCMMLGFVWIKLIFS